MKNTAKELSSKKLYGAIELHLQGVVEFEIETFD
jgi:hypothetical protein